MSKIRQAWDALEKGIFVHTDAPFLIKCLSALERMQGVDLEKLTYDIMKNLG